MIATMVNINSFPDELLRKIFLHPDLSYRDVKAAGKTCQRWSKICEEILKYRKEVIHIKASQSWKTPYREVYNIDEVIRAAFLAKQGYLTEVKWMNLISRGDKRKKDMNINLVPAGDLAKLSSCVSDGVVLNVVYGDLSIVFRNLKCQWLS